MENNSYICYYTECHVFLEKYQTVSFDGKTPEIKQLTLDKRKKKSNEKKNSANKRNQIFQRIYSLLEQYEDCKNIKNFRNILYQIFN